MRILILILALLLLDTASLRWTTPPPKLTPGLVVSSAYLRQGDLLIVELVNDNNPQAITVGEQDYSVVNLSNSNRRVALVPLSPAAQTGIRNIITHSGLTSTSVEIVSRDFGESVLSLPPKAISAGVTTKSLAVSLANVKKDELGPALVSDQATPLFKQAFITPLETWIDVGAFGKLRIEKSAEGKIITNIRHLGTDLDAPTGTAVRAINDGQVTLAKYLPEYGNTLVVDHGAGIFSLYLHLDSFATTTNVSNLVERGEIIGFVGNTGVYSFDPHLHFGIKVKSVSLDPKNFLETINKYLQ